MIRASGILFLVGDTALFLRRGNGGDHPNQWCCPGGQVEGDETAEQAAVRETMEECGFDVKPGELKPWTRTLAPADSGQTIDPGLSPEAPQAPSDPVDFTTFIVRLREQFTPTLSDEHDGYCWAPVGGPPLPIHPGVQVALDRIGWNELDIAEAMAAGRLASPQKYENLWLFAIRITGTGVAYRHGRKEFVWRDPALYMNERFMKRIMGLATIWEHPEKSLLNGKEFTKRAVGAVMLPYLRPDLNEVWAIARIHDEEAAREMDQTQLSTSPAVNFADPTENDRVRLDGGKVMLIEGDPSLIDHIAICPHGVWDKGGDPTGVESVNAIADELIIQDAAKPARILTIELNDGDFALPLAEFLATVANIAAQGHSFDIQADPEEKGPRVGIDGDGADRILRVLLDGKVIKLPKKAESYLDARSPTTEPAKNFNLLRAHVAALALKAQVRLSSQP